jgi:hypothetical protein
MVGNQVAVGVARRRAEPGDVRNRTHSPAAGRRPYLHGERTVPG